MRSKKIELYKAKLKLKKRQRDVLVGLLLGDGHLEKSPCSQSARLKVAQCARAKSYVEWLHSIFNEWIGTPVKLKNTYLKSTKKYYRQYYFSTYSHKEFMPYRLDFYSNGKKVVPDDIGKLLTPLGLAVWFMDDGSIKSHESHGRIINTHSFAESEIRILCNVLRDKFKLEAWTRKQRDGMQIYISGKSCNTLQKIIEPYILPVMRYKLPLHKD